MVSRSKTEFLEDTEESMYLPVVPTAKHTKTEVWVVFWFSFIFPLSDLKYNRIYTKNMNMYTHTVYNVYTEQRNHHPDSKGGDQDPVVREGHKQTNQNKQVENRRTGTEVG